MAVSAASTAVSTPSAPRAIGPYSQAIVAPPGARLVFCSGQIALDPASGELVGADDVATQTGQVMQNLAAVLAAAGTSFDRVLRSTLYLTSLADFATVNPIYGACFPAVSPPPARATVEVAALPRGARIEIELIAYV